MIVDIFFGMLSNIRTVRYLNRAGILCASTTR